MSALISILLAAAATADAPPPPPPPAVSMDVAKARVAKVKTLLAVAVSGDSVTLNSVIGAGANANMNGTTSPLTVAAIAPLRSCTRKGPFTVSDDAVSMGMTCTGSLPADTTVFITFAAEQISSVVAGPSAPPVVETN